MSEPRDGAASGAHHELEELLGTVAARLRVRDGLRATSAALTCAAAVIVVGRLSGLTPLATWASVLVAAALCATAISTWNGPLRTPRAAAALVERSNPHLRNLIVTAEELLSRCGRTPAYMRDRVLAEASRESTPVDPRGVVPLAGPLGAVLPALLLVGGALLIPPSAHRAQPSAVGAASTSATAPGDLSVDVHPPEYTRRPSSHVRNPSTLEVIVASRIIVTLSGVPPHAEPRVRLNGLDIHIRREGDSRIANAELTESGYLAVDGEGVTRRLIPTVVVPDHVPEVRILSPARDLHVANASGAIDISATAQDDLALASMDIRYTRISGAGEQYQFHEGTLTTRVDRRSGSDWRASARLSLAAMKLEPGDALVYRAVARDRRPGDEGLGTSDTYFVEIAGPGDVALAGFDMPPDRERYVLSQQMIVLKIERLRARESSMTKAALQEAAAAIASEQRAVRANFLFLLGGGIEDEEKEAESSTEILEGRFENRARQEILTATRLMTRVDQALGAVSTSEALPPAREAAQALQRAFGHSRYLLRALPTRARLDPSRRLTGDRTSAVDWLRALASPDSNASVAGAEQALRDLLRIAARMSVEAPSSGTRDDRTHLADDLGTLAERVLRIDPASADVQQSSKQLLVAREALLNGRLADVRSALNASAPGIVARAQRGRPGVHPATPALDRLVGRVSLEEDRR
jgi:hypothetical protein